MKEFINWSEVPAKRRHIYVYCGLLIFALAANSIKANLPSSPRLARRSAPKEEMMQFIGLANGVPVQAASEMRSTEEFSPHQQEWIGSMNK